MSRISYKEKLKELIIDIQQNSMDFVVYSNFLKNLYSFLSHLYK